MSKSIKASASSFKALRPSAKRTDVKVEGYRGLYIRVSPSAEKRFVYRSGQDGVMSRITLRSHTLSDAIAEWSDLRKRKRDGENIVSSRKVAKRLTQTARLKEKSEPTFSKLAERYIREHAQRHKRSWREDEHRLKRYVIPVWGNTNAKDISRADVHALVSGLATATPVLANRILALVRKVFSFAVDKDILTTGHPCLRMAAPAAETPRQRVLSDRELYVIWQVTDRAKWRRYLPLPIANAIRLQLLTGCRETEVYAARWEEFDIGRAEWTIPSERVKNKRQHLLPLTDSALTLIKDAECQKQGSFLFPWRGKAGHLSVNAVDKAMRRLSNRLRLIKIPPIRPHDLRRTVETRFASIEVSAEIRNRVLNHVDNSVSGRNYNMHDYKADKRIALARWEKTLLGLVAA